MNQKTSRKIHLLPEHLIDQIKAGEVVERPSALIKELLENSIDAGASKIDIQLINNGMDLISISDNGSGMNFEDLPYAFCRHATSKISRFEDLYGLHSFGFRGEALASIAAISRLTCQSIPLENLESGGKIIIHGGEEMTLSPLKGVEAGTSIFIKDLFYNTPARLKFIKSQTAEKNALRKIIQAFIISNPEITFSVKWDDKERALYPAVTFDKKRKRIEDILFKKKNDLKEILSFSTEYENHSVEGYISLNTTKTNTGKEQFLFVNNRLFFDKRLHQNILRTMDRLWGFGNYGNYCIFINAPADQIDVNVHPNKTEIKFSKQSIVHSLLTSGLKKQIDHIKSEKTSSPSSQTELMSRWDHSRSVYEQVDAHFFKSSEDPIERMAIPHSYDQSMVTEKGTVQSLNQQIFTYQNYLGLAPKLFALYWYRNTEARFPLDEKKITPLLISEPFQLKQSGNEPLLDLKTLGFEFDRLDNQTLVLRSVPNFLASFKPMEYIPILLETACKKSFKDPLQLLFEVTHNKYLDIQIQLNTYQIQALIEDVSITGLIDQKSLLPLNSLDVLGAFHG